MGFPLITGQTTNRWLGNSDRNSFGYKIMPLVGLLGLVSITTLSGVGSLLPKILFSPLFAVYPPVAIGAFLALGVMASCLYLAARHNKPVNNGFRLDFDDSKKTRVYSDKPKQVLFAEKINGRNSASAKVDQASDLELAKLGAK